MENPGEGDSRGVDPDGVRICTMSKAFSGDIYEQFCTDTAKYFGGWYIEVNKAELDALLQKKITLQLQLRHLILYLGSAEILKTQVKDKEHSFAQLYSKQLWFHTVLLLLFGLIDQNTQDLRDKNTGKVLSICKRFLTVMQGLDTNMKNDIERLYFNKKGLGSYEEKVWHICESRNFFAHEFDKAYENTPEDASMTFSPHEKHGYVISPNLPHGRLFIYLLIGLFRHLGFTGSLKVESARKYEKLIDFLSDDA